MKELIEALQIFLKYKDEKYPTSCEHDILFIAGITKDEVSEEDQKRLNELGFLWGTDDYCWISSKYGSA
jgi:hypothetical protein